MDMENVSKMLAPDEQILWASKTVPGELMDKNNKSSITRWFIGVAAVFVLLMVLYGQACAKAGTTIFSMVTVVFFIVAAVIFADPITTYNKLKKAEYAITNKRVIVCATADLSYTIPVAEADPVQVIEEENGTSTLVIGPVKKIRPSKLRIMSLQGNYIAQDNGEDDKPYPVLYRIPNADEAIRALKTARS